MSKAITLPYRSIFSLRYETAVGLKQALAMLMLVSIVWLIASLHLAVLARPLYVFIGVGLGIYYIRRSPWQYLTWVLWFWTLSPFMRRICDYYSQPDTVNIVLIAPNILTLLMFPSVITSKTLLKRREASVGLLLLVPAVYGLCVSFLRADIYAGTVAALDWIIPLIYYWYIIDKADYIDECKPYLDVFVPLSLAIISLYGIYQNFYPAPWDIQYWNFFKGEGDIFKSVPMFSVMTSVGIFAMWLVMLIVLSLNIGGIFSFFAMPVALLALVMTEVRAALGTLTLALFLAMIFGRGRLVSSLFGVLIAVMVSSGLFLALDSEVSSKLISRFSSVGDLQNDGSARVRQELFFRSGPEFIESHPFGVGIGAVGKGARDDKGHDKEKFNDLDSGIIAPFIVFGWVAGFVYFFGMVAVVIQAGFAAWRSKSQLAFVFAVNAAAFLTTCLFTMIIGIQGMIVWFSAACAVAIEIATQNQRDVMKARPEYRSRRV